VARTSRAVRLEAEGDDQRIGWDDLLGVGHDLGEPAPAWSGRPQPGADHFDAIDVMLAQDLDRLAVEQEFDPSSLLFL